MATQVSAGYVLKLWNFASLLLYRSEQVEGPEREILREQAEAILSDVEMHLGGRSFSEKDIDAVIS